MPVKEVDLREIRRQKSRLVCAGMGVIIFGAWDVMTFILYLLFSRERLMSLIDAEMLEQAMFVQGVFITVFVFLAIGLFIRIRIGSAAIRLGREGKTKHPRVLFVMAVYYVIYQIANIVSAFTDGANSLGLANQVMGLITSIVSLSIFIEIIIASYKLRRYEKVLYKEEEVRCS